MSVIKNATDREILEKFRENHPNLNSIHKIAAIPENEFVQQYADEFAGGVRQARRSHKTATIIQQRTAILWANIKDAASPLIRNALFNNIPQEFLDYQELIPGYNRLFDSLDYIECNSCRSVLSPAAYFVDLMRFVEENITENDNNNNIPAVCRLDRRRPDLFQLKLDCDNTNTLIPYIDIVNTALETIVTTAEKPDAVEVLEETVFPANLPLNLPLAEIRVYLEQLKLDLQQVYQVFQSNSSEQKQSIIREILSLSPSEFKLISDESSNPAEISRFYDLDLTADGLQTLANVETFLERTGLNRQELNDLIFQDLNQPEINLGLSRLFFINSADDGLGYLRIEQGASDRENPTRPPQEILVNLSSAKLARIYRFLKLSRQLGWSFVDLDWALRSLSQSYTPELILQFDGINDYVRVSLADSSSQENNRLNLINLQDTFTLEAWVNPTQHRLNPILSQGKEQDHSTHFLFWINETGKLSFYADALGNSNSEYPRSWQSLPLGQFSHVAVTVEAQQLKFYINGQLDRTISLSQAIIPPATPEEVNIGANLNDSNFEGMIKEVKIWSEVRSTLEIDANRYQRLTGHENELVAYWPLVEHPSRQLLDLTPNQNHGIMGGEEFVTQPRWAQDDLVLEPFSQEIGRQFYQFNGVDQYLATRRDVTGLATEQLTLEAWISLEEQGENYIISKGNEDEQQIQFLFWINNEGRLVWQSTSLENSREYTSQSSINLQEPTHVSVTVAEDAVRFYVNGILDREYFLSSPPVLEFEGNDLNIGRNFSDRYFKGQIYKVRLWNQARTPEQLNQYQHRVLPVDAPNLIGYWRLNQIEAGLAQDLSYNQNHLYLGGIPADYQPDRVEVEQLLPDLPIATTGSVLELDGDRDTIVIHHQDYLGLGHYEQITLEFWFRPQELKLRSERQQILFTQGDEEAGVNLYLYNQRLYAIAWCAEYQGINIQETVWVSEELVSDQWHHLAIINDESQALDFIEFKAYLNDTELNFETSSHVNDALTNQQKGFRLSPVGTGCLGGLIEPKTTRFQGEYSQPETRHLHCFKGQIAHFRLWQRRKTEGEIQAERYTAPLVNTADLVAYFPLNEGQGSTFQDLADQGYTGRLMGKDLVFIAQSADAELENIYSHYFPEGVDVLSWSNYIYTGQFYVAEPANTEIESGLGVTFYVYRGKLRGIQSGQDRTNIGIGITFFSHFPVDSNDQNQYNLYYRLRASTNNQRFHISPHRGQRGSGGRNVEGISQTDVTISKDTWYHFWIEVEDRKATNTTHIRAKIWSEGTPEPKEFQIDAFDRGRDRFTSGTVGLWTGHLGSKYFDNLQVRQGVFFWDNYDLADWQATGSRDRHEPNEQLFKTDLVKDNPFWLTVNDYPLLLNPLNLQGLQFDGVREYLAAEQLRGLELNAFTIEAWVNPFQLQTNPLLSWKIGERSAWFGINSEGKLVLTDGADLITGQVDLATNQFSHIALTIDGDRAIFYINGTQDTQVSLSSAVSLSGNSLEIGRDLNEQYFAGQIRDLRLWQNLRSEAQFVAGIRYQQPPAVADGLVAYWSFAQFVDAHTLDTSPNQNHLRLGGLEQARKPLLIDQTDTPDFWRPDRAVLEFNYPDQIVVFTDDQAPQTIDRRTIEVWFKVDDQYLTERKQVIYHEGNDQQGLTVYVHDGYLYFGGYHSASDYSNWSGTWLQSDRITSNRWHHAALVLDGRSQLRPYAFQGFLDGKLAGIGAASQLREHNHSFTLGGVQGSVRFHDGDSAGTAYYLQGQVMELRIWNTALTPELIAERRYQQLIGDEANLFLWWQFDEVANLEIPDLSGNGRVSTILQSEQLQQLGEPITSVLPPVNLNAATLERLATIRQLQERHNQPLERLTALWFSIKHVGEEDGQTLYDRLFNPTSLAAEPWPYYPHPPIRWDVTGQENQRRDRQIRSRLMGALQVSSQDLDRIVEYLSGSETPVELDNTYLTQLYRLTQIARTLRLQVRELFRLLELIELAGINTLEDFQQVSDRAELMRRIGISIDELDFLMNDIQSDRIRLSYTDTDIRNLADDLTRQSIEFLIRVNSFVSEEISEFKSIEIIEQLEKAELLQTIGEDKGAIPENQYSVTDKYQDPTDLQELAIEQNWVEPFTALQAEGVNLNIFTRLQEAGFVDINGIILRQDLDQFSEAFRDENDNLLLNPTDLANIQDVLERQNNLQIAITQTLVRSRDEHANAVLAGLSELLRVEPEPLQAVIDYFQSIGELLSDRTLLLEQFMAIEENQPIPTDINDYLYRLSKILYLVAEFELTTTETQALLRNPDWFSVSDVFRPNLTDLTNLFTFSELKSAFNDVEGNLIQIFQQTQPQDIINRIFELTNWEPRQIEALMTHFGSDITYNRVAGLNRLRQGFELAEILQTNISFPIQLANTENLTLQFYQQQSSALFPVLRARYDDEQWARVYKTLRDRLALQKRDALLSLAVYQSIPEDFAGRRSPDLLSEYLLLDVQVSTEVETSHIVQGTAALQLYAQRCLMSLEKGVNPATIPTDQWEWMKNYRVWEANRKVFLYPESYIEPELRDTKTPLFEDLEQELMQNDINQDSVTQAYMNYLNQFAEIANLKIVGSYLHRDSDDNEILYLVGRTNTQPGIHYYREYRVNDSRWLPWKKIDLTINSEIVTPVVAFGRLFLFWVEFVESSESVGGDGNERSVTIFQATVQFSFLNVNGTWIQPQTYDLGIRTAADTPAVQETLTATSSAYNNVQSFVGGLQPNAVNRSQLEEMLSLVEIYAQSLRDTVATLRQINTNTNEESEQLELIESRIEAQATQIEVATSQLRDALSQLTGFISIIFDSFAAEFINVFDNFADLANAALADIPTLLSTITVRGLTLSTSQRNQYEWQRVYAQQAVQFAPTEPNGQIEGNARVLQITAGNVINTPIPNFGMDELTWSFWVNFVNSQPDGTVERSTTTTTLLDYNNGRVQITAANVVTAIPGIEPAIGAANAAIAAVNVVLNIANAADPDLAPSTVVQQTQTALNSANAAVNQARNTARISDTMEQATEQLAQSAAQLLQAANNEALTQRPLAAATIIIINTANSAITNLSAAIGSQLRWESRTVRLSLARFIPPDIQVLDQIELGYDRWHHIAVTMGYEARNGNNGYAVNLYRDGELIATQAFAGESRLPSAQPLLIGQSSVPDNQTDFITQMSEFWLWEQVRERDAIAAERDERKTGQEVGLRLHLPLNQEIPNNLTLSFVRSVLIFRFGLSFTPIRERERLILFYGSNNEIIRSRRNNQNDESFNLLLMGQAQDIPNYDLTLSTNFELYIGQNRQLTTDSFNSVTANPENTLLRNLIPNEAIVRDVHNQPGWYVLDTGDEQFLLQADVGNERLMTIAERLNLSFSDNSNLSSQPISLSLNPDPALQATENDNLPRFQFTRLSTFAAHQLIANLFRGGTDELLSLTTQQTEEVNFNLYDANPQLVIPPPRSISNMIDFDGAYGLYYWEIFFHIPFFIANQLNSNQNFADAQRWYHYIFNPTTPASTDQLPNPNDRYWRFLPFTGLDLETLAAILDETNPRTQAALAAYREDPFDPHAIARLRINAYQKAIVMKYIDNLLDWGDNLFAQESRESINEAFLLYVLAFNLLGPRPEARASQQFQEIGNYEGIRDTFDDVPEFLTELDLNGNVAGRTSTITLNQNGNIITTFCVPENAEFISFWDRVEDRLFKIRHSLNIEGIFRQLPLFQPPLDVRALVQAFASGGRDIGSLLSDLNVAVPHYRYAFMLDRAKEIIGNVRNLGSALLSALESRDAEQLAVLQNTHERNILELTTRILELERDEAEGTLEALRISQDNIQNRLNHFTDLIDNGLSDEELADLSLIGISQVLKSAAGLAKSTASALNGIPDFAVGGAGIASPVTITATGGSKLADAISDISDGLEISGDLSAAAGSITAKVGEYKRRENDWRLEKATAEFDLQEVEQQIAVTELQVQRTEQALTIHERSIQNNQEVATFYRSKFTNEALYNWMIGRLSGLYFQAYKLAYDFAKSAERALQYELPTNERFISFGHWDSLRRGLLAGESLMLDLNRMEKFHLDNDSRFQEIEKTVPLSRINREVLDRLIDNGECEFNLSEALFNRDYPGHYFRVLKTIAISIKFPENFALRDDPYLTINSTLTQLGNKTLLDPDLDAVRYLMGIEGAEQPSGNTLRVNWRANQQIAVSSPRQDNGMFGSFDLNFVFDDRYFPFEGTGAVSNWHLEIPHATNPDLVRQVQGGQMLEIEDVIIHLKYTSKFDRGAFKQAVAELITSAI